MKHEHIYGADRKMFLYPNGNVVKVDKFYCIDCGFTPNHTTRRKLRNIADTLPMDILFFVVNKVENMRLFGFYTTQEKFDRAMRQRLSGDKS